MLTFVSLFLGLLIGPHTVELAVGEPVAMVEIRLDGTEVARLDGEPWATEVDLGERLTPHELLAIGYDAEGEEVARARQWINLPRPRAEAALVIHPPETPGRPVRAELVWKALSPEPPAAISLSFDGRELEVADPSAFELPDHDPRSIHLLSAELEFPGGLRSRVEAVFGGVYTGRVTTDMTAVALVRKRRRLPGPEELAGVLLDNGSPLEVVATDQGSGEVVVVLERGALLSLGTLGLVHDRQATGGFGNPLGSGEHIRFQAATTSHAASTRIPYDLFPVSQGFSRADGTLEFLVTHVAIKGPDDEHQRIADAVAAAGVQAAAGNRPRAVVLILGPDHSDVSRFAVDEVKAYLTRLRVPLLVWVTGPAHRRVSEDRRPHTVRTPWGPALEISSLGRLSGAARELRRTLDDQLIAWVAGTHRPDRVELAATEGLTLAGSP